MPGRVAFRSAAGPFTQADMLARAERLAAQLPDCPLVVNYCERRDAFALALMAAWMRGQTALFPADRGEHTFSVLSADHPGLYIRSDSPLPFGTAGDVVIDMEGLAGAPAAGAPFVLDASHPAAKVFTLLGYVEAGICTAECARLLSLAVVERRNILVAGGTSSGKTTLANALLAEMATLDERVILIEDTRELQCPAPDRVELRTRAGHVSMADLVRSTLRLRPDRIIVGEVRGPEALDMLKAWNTGHPGGIATIHANSAPAALTRVEQLVQESVVSVPRRLIAEAIDLVVFIAGRGLGRRIATLARVDGVNEGGAYALSELPIHSLDVA